MSPVHFKSSKRKILRSTDSVLKTEIFQQVADADDNVDNFVKRQDIQSSLSLHMSSTSSYELPTFTAITTSTPSPNSKPQGQDPLSSVPVQLILGLLGFVLIAVLMLRCFCLQRQHRAMRRDPQVSLEHAVPTNEMTLAGRLRTYQAAADANRYIYSSERSATHVSVGSFIAPSYDNDISPPPFMASSGKPPSYAETVAIRNV